MDRLTARNRARFVAKGGPRKSNGNTPIPGDAGDQPTTADKLNYADLPRPFKSKTFTSRLPYRTGSNTQFVKKNLKQILALERERVSGGDGFLTATQTGQRARGEVVEMPGKKKKSASGGGTGAKRGSNLMNLKNRKGAGVLGNVTPSEAESRVTTPDAEEDEEEVVMDVEEMVVERPENTIRKEIITYHTPTAPPSLLPPKKYCDITGLHASYTDPRTKLRYKGLEVWNAVRSLGPGGDQAYLSLRNAQTSLK